ncbi:MAG: type II toxin-antitoxin system RelE/ParE family toxin [Bacteroidales bacterium]|nr:type II toxin-antitoxin system RelE/ParE family toxin [Bacteroidales bacterium]MCF8333966.1 type II toxin-antitoxin system RelE/ParE family toxin [Bacteroidales bacterium]
MADYTVRLTRKAEKQLDKIPYEDVRKILNAIGYLAHHPRPQGSKKLKDREAYRIRQGDYRIIYEIYDKLLVIEVIAIGHRKDIYR